MRKFLFCFLLVLSGSVWSQRLSPGNTLPFFRTVTVQGDSISPASLKGKKVLFMFNRYVNCPLCNFRAHELLAVYDSLKAGGMVIVSVYESGMDQLKAYASDQSIPFIMVADPGEILYRKFGVLKSGFRALAGVLHKGYRKKHADGEKQFRKRYRRDGSMNRMGADFLVDEQGIIRMAYYGKYAGDHLPVGDILRWLSDQRSKI